MYVERHNQDEKFVIVPMEERYENRYTKAKATKPLQYLLLTLNNKETIRRADIMLFYPKDLSLKKLPKNSFYSFFNLEEIAVDGTMAMLSIEESWRYEMDFENSKKAEFRVWRSEKSKNVSNRGEFENCIDWYLVTTIYYVDGTSHQYSTYLFTRCNGCLPDENCIPEEGSGGGGGGIPVDPVTVTKSFVVYAYHQNFDNWNIVSTHQLSGYRYPSNSALNFFTGITDNPSVFTDFEPAQCYEPSSTCHKVYQHLNTMVSYNSTIATATSNNTVYYPHRNEALGCNRTYSWQAETVFQ